MQLPKDLVMREILLEVRPRFLFKVIAFVGE